MGRCIKSSRGLVVLVAGYEEAFIGVGVRSGSFHHTPVAVYSMSLAVDLLVARRGIDSHEARRYLYDFVRQIDMDEGTPIWVEEMTLDELHSIVRGQPEVVH